jgi:serine/threonine protein kinase
VQGFNSGWDAVVRDIKPSNIFLVGNKAVIADLGLGRLLSSPSALAYSKVGTPLYFRWVG